MKDWVKWTLFFIGLTALIIIGNLSEEDYSECDPYGTMDHGCRAQERGKGDGM